MLHGIRGVFSLREYPELLNVLSQETISNIGKLVFHRVANQDDALTLQFRNLALVRGNSNSPSVTERSNFKPPEGWKVSPLTMSSARWNTVESHLLIGWHLVQVKTVQNTRFNLLRLL